MQTSDAFTTSRRRALGRIAGVSLLVGAPATAALDAGAAEVDPHPEWKRRRLELRELINGGGSDGPDSDVLFGEACRLDDLIADTPARTFAGVATQIWLATDAIEEWVGVGPDDLEHRALRNALAALERLAGAGEGRA